MTEDELRAYAALLLEVGVGFQPGKDLAINAQIEHAPLARMVADEAYRRGAAMVDLWYWDPHTKRSRLMYAPDETLGRVPAMLDARYRDLGERQGALVNIVGDPEPDLLADVDPARAGLDRMPALASRYVVQATGLVEWTIGCYPTDAWAQLVLGRPDAAALWADLKTLLRLDTADPVAAWRDQIATLQARCDQLNALRFDALHYEGPGTDLKVGLFPRQRWGAASLRSRAGISHVCNLPTEEIYTVPDPTRAEGVIRSTKPLALGGSLIEGLELRLAGGKIVEVNAARGADVVRGNLATDPGAAQLGEVALVDRTSRVLQSGLTYYLTLLDENASCHIAWGGGIATGHLDYDQARPESAAELGINQSATHVDFMVGAPDVTVTGIHADGRRQTILANETWQL